MGGGDITVTETLWVFYGADTALAQVHTLYKTLNSLVLKVGWGRLTLLDPGTLHSKT